MASGITGDSPGGARKRDGRLPASAGTRFARSLERLRVLKPGETMRLREQAWRVAAVLVFVSSAAGAAGQTGTPKPPAPQPAAPAEPADALGRSTPKGTVVGFLNAARRGEGELARQYLDTRLGEN